MQSGAGQVRQEGTGRIVVSGFTSRGAGLSLLNKAYQEAIKQGRPVVLIHGASHCVGCKKMVAAAEQAGMTIIYLEDDAEKMGTLFSLPQIFVLPADPNLRLEAGQTPVRSTVPGVDEHVAYRARGMQRYDNHQKIIEQQIKELGDMIAAAGTRQ